MISKVIYTIFLYAFLSACAQVYATNATNDYIELAKSKFVNLLSGKYDSFELCEAHSTKDDKREFLNQVFPQKYFNKAIDVKSAELYATHENAKMRLHLGLIDVKFDNPKEAKGVFDRIVSLKQNEFDNTMILTRYKVFNKASDLVFVYSETFRSEELIAFFDKLDGIFNFNN